MLTKLQLLLFSLKKFKKTGLLNNYIFLFVQYTTLTFNAFIMHV